MYIECIYGNASKLYSSEIKYSVCEIKFLKCFVPKKYSLLPRYSILNRTCYIS